VPPDAVIITLPPAQNVVEPVGVMTGIGSALTVTAWLAVAVHPLAFVTVTVYVVVVAGETVIAAVVAELLH
jgi:hypothetical protein